MSYEISNIYTVDTAARFPLGTTSFDHNTGWMIKYVQFTSGYKFDHGDGLYCNAGHAVIPNTGANVNAVCIHPTNGVNAYSAAKYGWVAVPGSVNPVWVNYDPANETGSAGIPSGGLDCAGVPLIYTASGAAYPNMGKLTKTTRSAYTSATFSATAELTAFGAAFQAENTVTDYQAKSSFIGASAVSAFSATGNAQSAYLRSIPDNYIKVTANQTPFINLTASGLGPISSFVKAGDTVIYGGEARVLSAVATASDGTTATFHSTGFTSTTAATTATGVKVGKQKVLAYFKG